MTGRRAPPRRPRPPDGYMVYLLIDPRDRLPFYCGMTCRPGSRWYQHNTDLASRACWRLQQLRQAGLKCHVRLLALNLTYEQGRQLESETIARHKATLQNVQVRFRQSA